MWNKNHMPAFVFLRKQFIRPVEWQRGEEHFIGKWAEYKKIILNQLLIYHVSAPAPVI